MDALEPQQQSDDRERRNAQPPPAPLVQAARNVQYLLTKKLTTIPATVEMNQALRPLPSHGAARFKTIKLTISASADTAMNERPSRPTWPVDRNVQARLRK